MEEAVAVALMEAVAVEVGSTEAVGGPLTGAEACAPVEEAGLAGDLIRLPLPDTEALALHPLMLLMLRALAASTRRAPATPIPGQAAISRADLSGVEIRPLRQMVLPTASGIPLAAHLEAADLRVRAVRRV
jgi:hypothetical protein